MLVRLHMVTVAVAASYLTLGLFSVPDARRLWAVYGLVTFALAVATLIVERRLHDR